MTSWLIVTSPENFQRTRDLGFTLQGVKRRHALAARRVAAGDRVCWYVTGVARFAATAMVTAPSFEASDRIWVSEGRDDAYPWRFRLAPGLTLDPARGPLASDLAHRLRFVRRWPAAHWRLAFQGNLHEIGDDDFSVIERALAASAMMAG